MIRRPLFAPAMATLLLTGLIGLAAVGPAFSKDVRYHRSDTVKELGLPFSDAVQVGQTLYLSGQIGAVPGSLELAPGGMAGQARQAMDNIGAVLAAHNAGFEHVFKCTVMLGDMGQWADFNKVYVTYFKPDAYPARSAFGANGLALGGLVEVECWAHLPPRS